MDKMRDRLERLEKEQIKDDEFIKSRRPPDFVPTARNYNMKSHDEFFFAICDYILRHDIEGFRSHLIESTKNKMILFKNHDAGGTVDDSYVAMNSFRTLFRDLAADDFKLAKEFANLLGGREELEKKNDLPFYRTFGYALKACILDDGDQMEHWLPIAMKEAPKRNEDKKLIGYPEALVAIYNKDEAAFDKAMQKINKDHGKLSIGSGLFVNTPQEVINVWGLGLINLARHKGLDVTFNDDEYLPKELIV